MKYKVLLSGFCYVEADSQDDAVKKVFEEDYLYSELSIGSVVVVDEFIVGGL